MMPDAQKYERCSGKHAHANDIGVEHVDAFNAILKRLSHEPDIDAYENERGDYRPSYIRWSVPCR